MSRLRVFHLIKSLGRGGAETLLSQGYASANHDDFEFGYGYFLPHKDAMARELQGQGADVTCFGGDSSAEVMARAPLVAKHLYQWKADVLHCHLPISGAVGRVVGKLLRIPVVYTEHNVLERYRTGTRRLDVATWRLCDRVIAVSEEVAASARRHAGERVPLEVVRNGVDVQRFARDEERRARARESLGCSDDSYVIGTCAVFREQKRLDRWLDVAARIGKETDKAHFVLVGEGPLRSEVEEKIREHGLGDRVTLPGLVDDVRPFLDAMDVFLMTSEFEGLPVAMLEAMAMETAVVATAVGGVAEVLEEEAGGIAVADGDVDALGDALMLLFRAPPHRHELARRGRQRVESFYSMEQMQGRLEEIYREVARKR